MKKLLEYIKSINPAYKDIKFVSVIYHRGAEVLECKMVYQGSITEEDKNNIASSIKTYIGRPVDVVVKLKKSILDKEVITMLVNQYLKDHYASLYENFDTSKIETVICGQDVTLTIGFLPVFYQFIDGTEFKRDILNYLDNHFFANFTLTIYQYDGDAYLNQSLQKLEKQISDDIFSMDILKEKRYIDVTNVTPIVGEMIEQRPIAIADQSLNEETNVICGKIQFLQKKTYKPKKATSDSEEKVMFAFQLRDYTGTIRCVAFPTQKTVSQLETLTDGMEVIIDGKIDEFNASKSMRVKNISGCQIVGNQAKQEEVFVQKSCPTTYRNVSPEPYIIKKQVDLFSVMEKEPCQYLKENQFVVFDLETTGLDYQTNSITEIGGIKIKEGKIVETFSTLVKSKEEISAEITKLTGITNSMVENQLPIEEIIGDFYKFCDGCVLVGHNIDFDYKFIFKAGRENGYLFNHKQQDTLFLAREQLKGLKNYKLGTIAEYLGVKLDNAHRAVFDALATAEVFIKLAENIK